MICDKCGNIIVIGSGSVCLVCQHTDRDSGKAMEAHARGLSAALDAMYRALAASVGEPDREKPKWLDEQEEA